MAQEVNKWTPVETNKHSWYTRSRWQSIPTGSFAARCKGAIADGICCFHHASRARILLALLMRTFTTGRPSGANDFIPSINAVSSTILYIMKMNWTHISWKPANLQRPDNRIHGILKCPPHVRIKKLASNYNIREIVTNNSLSILRQLICEDNKLMHQEDYAWDREEHPWRA